VFEKTRAHIREHKTVYVAATTGAVVGSAITAAVVITKLGGLPVDVSMVAKNQALIVWKPEITQIALVRNACPTPIPVLDKVTGHAYESLRAAAKTTGETLAKISADAQGDQLRWEQLPDSVFKA
jgi:hypothetical protein